MQLSLCGNELSSADAIDISVKSSFCYVLLPRYSHLCLLNVRNCFAEEVSVSQHETLVHSRFAVAVSRASMLCIDLNVVAIPLPAGVRHLHGARVLASWAMLMDQWH